MKVALKLYNSLTRQKEDFTPVVEGRVGLYVCGPTVYSDVHLGNCRTFISFDLIYRYLLYLGYKVRYVRNVTDVGHLEGDVDTHDAEDKISKKARLEQLEPMEIAQKYTTFLMYFHRVLSREQLAIFQNKLKWLNKSLPTDLDTKPMDLSILMCLLLSKNIKIMGNSLEE